MTGLVAVLMKQEYLEPHVSFKKRAGDWTHRLITSVCVLRVVRVSVGF